MIVPSGLTRDQVFDAVERAIHVLAPTFTFGSYGRDDIAQQCWVFALELLEKEKYDTGRPLVNFVYAHLRNRLINLKRDKYKRAESPCEACHWGNYCRGHKPCERYQEWYDRNVKKMGLAAPVAIDNFLDRCVAPPEDLNGDLSIKELSLQIDESLPAQYRADFARMKAGVHVPKARREEIEGAVREIVGEYCGG